MNAIRDSFWEGTQFLKEIMKGQNLNKSKVVFRDLRLEDSILEILSFDVILIRGF